MCVLSLRVGVLRWRLRRSSSYPVYFAWRCLLYKYCHALAWGLLFIIELLIGFICSAWGSSTSTSCSQDWRSLVFRLRVSLTWLEDLIRSIGSGGASWKIGPNSLDHLIPIQHPYIRDLMVSIKVFGKLVVEPKTLGWEHSPERFRIFFENLGVVSTPLKCFQMYFWQVKLDMKKEGVGGFIKRHWCFFVVARNN
jgi:hypothetical protein